jgi:hypothetical protein
MLPFALWFCAVDICSSVVNSSSPALRYFRDGQYVTDYTGSGAVQDVLQFVKTHPKKVEL